MTRRFVRLAWSRVWCHGGAHSRYRFQGRFGWALRQIAMRIDHD